MRRYTFLMLFLFAALPALCQQTNKGTGKYTVDINLYKAQYNHLPQDISQKFFSIGYAVYLQYKIPIIDNKLTALTGFGICVQDLKYNGQVYYSAKGDTTYITPLAAGTYDKNKMNFTFLEIPMELRYTPTKKGAGGFMISGGLSLGYLVDDYVKTTGKDANGNKTKVKVYYTHNLLPIRAGIRGKIGYGGFCLFGYYNLTRLFETNQGPPINYYSVGLSLGGF